MSYALSKAVDSSRVFIERKANVTGRWDPFYHRPELVALEKQVRAVTPNRLRDFVKRMAGGATPPTSESKIHYTEEQDGVPFIRVQNLSTTGRLSLEDCKRIARSTHEGLLRRSRLTGGELLVKITGVGRMAVASVVPESFEGNINQHIAAIKTKGIATSEALAAWLNLDIAERLASRRSTGGTRPALDYPALLSIPVVVDARIPQLTRIAVEKYQAQLAEAEALLATTDDVLLDELGVVSTQEPPNTLEDRIFTRTLSSVSGRRIDPAASWRSLSLAGGAFPLRRFSDVAAINPVTRFPRLPAETLVSFVPMDAVSDAFGEIAESQTRPLGKSGSYTPFVEEDVIWAKITPCMENGKSAVARNLQAGLGYGSTEFHVFRRKTNELHPDYLHHFLRLKAIRQHARLNFTGSSGHQRVDEGFFYRLNIPFPPLRIQERIAAQVDAVKENAKTLFSRARTDLDEAKRNIEAFIFEESGPK